MRSAVYILRVVCIFTYRMPYLVLNPFIICPTKAIAQFQLPSTIYTRRIHDMHMSDPYMYRTHLWPCNILVILCVVMEFRRGIIINLSQKCPLLLFPVRIQTGSYAPLPPSLRHTVQHTQPKKLKCENLIKDMIMFSFSLIPPLDGPPTARPHFALLRCCCWLRVSFLPHSSRCCVPFAQQSATHGESVSRITLRICTRK